MSLAPDDVERLVDILNRHRSKEYNTGRPAATRDNEAICPECNARITKTPTYGEVGHRIGCIRREEMYKGQRGRRKKSGSYQDTIA